MITDAEWPCGNIRNMSFSTQSMDISGAFRPEDLSKTDFFDFVTSPDVAMESDKNHTNNDGTSDTTQQPLQGFDQVITGATG